MADINPANFANLATEKVKEIASMGGKASHGHGKTENEKHQPGRNPDGTFVKGSEAAKEAGHLGGLHAHGETDETHEHLPGRRHDGTFLPGSKAAKEAGHLGGLHAQHLTGVNELEVQTDDGTGRNPDGTFKKGSEAAKDAGHVGGMHAHGKDCHH